ncbi:beta-1,6-N-acetylglucosaminyltransferase [Rhabdobacter roseus]
MIFIQDRLKVNWKGYSIVEATLRLMAKGLDVVPSDSYLVLLSGNDYPIKPISYLRQFFQDANHEYLSYWRLVDKPTWLHKIRYYYFFDVTWLNPRTSWFSRQWTRGYFRVFRYLLPRRRYPPELVAYGGAAWWALSYGCVKYVLEYMDQNPWLAQFYRLSDGPDEQLFQTIILNSPFKEKAIHYARYQQWAQAGDQPPFLTEEVFHFRYIDWALDRERPALLDERDWEKIKQTPAWMARKLDERCSAALLDQLDRYLEQE